MSSSTTPSAPQPVKRACDNCHRRKVRCKGENAKNCDNCISAGLKCTYNAVPQKKGPKGSRAKVLSELRESQKYQQYSYSNNDTRYEGRSISPAWARTPGLVNQELAHNCADYFFSQLYPSQPILHRQQINGYITAMDSSLEPYCFVTAFCAYIMQLQRNGYGDTNQSPSQALADSLLEEAVRVRRNCSYTENPTFLTVLTSFYLFGCYWTLDRSNTAWYHLREATTHAHSLKMQEEDSYKDCDPVDATRRRRMFWLLFITERLYALHKHRPLTLHATIQLPTIEEDPTERIPLTGFLHLINLFKPFDDTFIGLWNKIRTNCLPTWLLQLQEQLSKALPSYLECTESQMVDLQTSQLWLKTMVWQLSISHQFISGMSPDSTMMYKYPIDFSREWIEMSMQFSQQAMEVHGVGLIEKLFDVACTLTDVMSWVPLHDPYDSSFSSPPSPRDYLHRFLNLISTLRSGNHTSRYTSELLQKISSTLPTMSAQLNINVNPGMASTTANYPGAPPTITTSGLPNNPQTHHGSAMPGSADTNTTVFDDGSGSGSVSISGVQTSMNAPGVPLRAGPGANSVSHGPTPGTVGHNVNVNVSVGGNVHANQPQQQPQQHQQQRTDYHPQQTARPTYAQHTHPTQQHHGDYKHHVSPHTPTNPYGFPTSNINSSMAPGFANPEIGNVGVGVSVGVSSPANAQSLYGIHHTANGTQGGAFGE